MTLRSIIFFSIPIFLIVGVLNPAAGFRQKRSCCTSYDKVDHFKDIAGYSEQSTWEHCRIHAIILITTSGQKICANPKEEWVKKTLNLLRSKLEKLSE